LLNRYYVIDNFFDNPQGLVEVALESVKDQKPAGNYAGLTSPKAYLGLQQREIFQSLTQEPSINSSTDGNGRIRFTRPGDSFKQNIHFDGFVATKWAGVVYLSKDHPQVDGTVFWRHKRTGLEEVPRNEADLAKSGWNNREGIKHLLETEGVDDSLWEKTLVVPYKFNRLILFRPWMFHSPGPAFGDTLETSRIVQTLFLGN